MASNSDKNIKQEHPIALEWTISEEKLKALIDSVKNEYLISEKFSVFHFSGIKYHLRIYPNGHSNSSRGQIWVVLFVEIGSKKKVESEYTFSIASANWNRKLKHDFDEKPIGWGTFCCTVNGLFDANRKFIVDGKFTVKLEGVLKISRAESEIKMRKLREKFKLARKFYDLWNIGFEDFTIVSSDGKELKVHKNVLAAQSPVFAAMFKPHTKESMEGKVEISDFTFEIIEKSIKFCYHPNLLPDISIDNAIGIFTFGDKYIIQTVRHDVEFYFGNKLTLSNFSETTKFAIFVNAMKLKNICSDFLIDCISKKIDVPKIEEIDAEFIAEIQKNLLCHSFETL